MCSYSHDRKRPRQEDGSRGGYVWCGRQKWRWEDGTALWPEEDYLCQRVRDDDVKLAFGIISHNYTLYLYLCRLRLQTVYKFYICSSKVWVLKQARVLLGNTVIYISWSCLFFLLYIYTYSGHQVTPVVSIKRGMGQWRHFGSGPQMQFMKETKRFMGESMICIAMRWVNPSSRILTCNNYWWELEPAELCNDIISKLSSQWSWNLTLPPPPESLERHG